MLSSFETKFNYIDFEKKLRHYFTDTAPIYANVELRLNSVHIFTEGKLPIDIILDNTLSVKKNINLIIINCEQYLYPRMLAITKASGQAIAFSEDEIKKLLFMGHTLEQIHKKESKINWQRFIIIRFNTEKNSIDFKDELTKKRYRAHFYNPLVIFRDTILRLANEGQEGMCNLYKLITENSRIEEFEEADA
jgi:cellulose biosynthesis protein BcsQ